MPQQSAQAAIAHTAKKAGATIRKVPRVQSITHRKSAATIWTVTQLLQGYGDPRAILLQNASMTIDAIVKATGCTRLEAFQEKRLCAIAVLPYVAQKLPVQVDMRHTRAIHLNILAEPQYREIEQLATQEQTLIEGQVLQHIGTESDAEDAHNTNGASLHSSNAASERESETDVRPPVSQRAQDGSEPGSSTP